MLGRRYQHEKTHLLSTSDMTDSEIRTPEQLSVNLAPYNHLANASILHNSRTSKNACILYDHHVSYIVTGITCHCQSGHAVTTHRSTQCIELVSKNNIVLTYSKR